MIDQDEQNPYAAPEADLATGRFAVVDGAPRYRLFSPGQATWAGFLGTPIAGCALLALNYRRLGQAALAITILLFGALASFLYLGLSVVLTTPGRGTLIAICSTVWIYAIAAKLQGSDFRGHLNSGGRRSSYWAATGIGLLSLVILFFTTSLVLNLFKRSRFG